MKTIEEMIQEYITVIGDDYAAFSGRTLGTPEQVDAFRAKLSFTVGKTYAKVISNTSVHSFIVLTEGNKFQFGDILKAASWKSPAKNFSRGNIVTQDYSTISWTGA